MRKSLVSVRAFRGLWFAALPALLVLLLAAVFCGDAAVDARPDAGAETARRFLSQYGWEVDEASCEITEVRIPPSFGAVYESYNDLQRAQGFDLSAYRGKALLPVTFSVINFPGYENSSQIRGNVFLDGDRVAAADLCSVEADGFICGVVPGGETPIPEQQNTYGKDQTG